MKCDKCGVTTKMFEFEAFCTSFTVKGSNLETGGHRLIATHNVAVHLCEKCWKEMWGWLPSQRKD